MKTSINVIKYTFIISLVSLVVTYLITVNIESDFISFNTVWMSNNFLLTIFGGIFASTLVVLLCETQKYHLTKLSNENQIYYQTLFLYSELYFLKKNIEHFLKTQEEIVPDNLFDHNTNNAMCQINCLINLEYITFSKNNKLSKSHESFCDKLQNEFLSSIQNGPFSFRIAIGEERIKHLNLNEKERITSKDELVNKTLSEQNNNLSNILSFIDDYLNTISEMFPKRFDWQKNKKTIQCSYKTFSKPETSQNYSYANNNLNMQNKKV